jgi:hypothetical protein
MDASSGTWAERSREPPITGHIRPLFPPRLGFEHWWYRDRSLTEWVAELEELQQQQDTSGDVIVPATTTSDVQLPSASALHPPGYGAAVAELFHEIQAQRWRARKVLNRLRYRIWSRRIQCDVDLIDMAPIPSRDRILLTDTKNRTIFAFHRRDIFQNLLSNIGAASEMLPSPRLPTNPWTNQPLTRAQTMSLCQKLLLDYAQRGKCPPVLFAAFCAAKYDIRRFESENSALLAQHAIRVYFADLHEHNRDTVTDTVTQLLDEHGIRFSPVTVRRWFRQTPVTPLHREWLDLARDYTLHLNLHIQPRPSWHDDAGIARDVRRLYARTDFSGVISPRLRLLRADASGSPMPVPATPGDSAALAAATAAISAFDATDTLAAFAAVSDSLLFTTQMPAPTPMTFTPLLFTTISTSTSSSSSSQPLLDPSGNPISTAEALNLLRSTLWRM